MNTYCGECGDIIGALDKAEYKLRMIRVCADQHADWCCAKGCNLHHPWNDGTDFDPCNGACNCESAPFLKILDGTS